MRDQLIERWERLFWGINDLEFSINEFKELFVDTWDYFVTAQRVAHDERYIERNDLEIIVLMAKILGVDTYPDDEKQSEYDTARQFLEGFLNCLSNEGRDISNDIAIPFDGWHESTVERLSFEASFSKELEINKAKYEE